MTDVEILDRAFAAIIARMVATGQAPHYVELAAELGLAPDAGREVVHDLFAAGIPGWVHPGTDYIASFPPFNNQPTQYRITVDGEQQWFAQCGVRGAGGALAVPGADSAGRRALPRLRGVDVRGNAR